MPVACHMNANAWLFALALLLAGCQDAGSGASATQLAARVNRDEISIHQVQQVLQRQPRLVAEQPASAAKKVLDALVEQQLAVGAARAQGLEQDPRVVQAIEVAKREVLARAYQDRLAEAASSPTSADIDSYYDSKPALFSERRLYSLQEFVVESAAADLQGLAPAVKEAKSADDIAAALRRTGLRARARQFVQAAEDLPMPVLERIAALPQGQSLILPVAGGARIYTVLHAQPAAVDKATAREAIGAFLLTERKRQLVGLGMKTLRDAATIEYLGAFAEAGAPIPR